MKLGTALMLRLLGVYAAVACFGIVVITFHNLYVNHLSIREFFGGAFAIKVLLGIGLVVGFQSFTHWRLRDARRYLNGETGRGLKQRAWERLLRFPAELFWGMIAYGAIVSPTYHTSMLQWNADIGERQTSNRMYVMENMLFDQALTLTLAALFYVVLQRVSRAGLSRMSQYGLAGVRASSFIPTLISSVAAMFLISMFSMQWFVSNQTSSGRAPDWAPLIGIGAFTFALGTVLLAVQAYGLRRQFADMIARLRSLLEGGQERLHGKMPVVSRDEIGQLTAAFNELQDNLQAEYDVVERELRLAGQVQQRLLPPPDVLGEGWRVCGMCVPSKDVGGDFYDVIELEDGRTAVMIGDVSGKGVQAALVMSAVVTLMRSEIRDGGSPADVLSRLNRLLIDVAQTSGYVTMGLGIYDSRQQAFAYASAGHVAPYVLRNGKPEELECGSLPLGIDPDAKYGNVLVPAAKGDVIAMYTDGVIEATEASGEMLGFDRFGRMLLDAVGKPAEPLPERLNRLRERLPKHAQRHEDDRTIVLIEL